MKKTRINKKKLVCLLLFDALCALVLLIIFINEYKAKNGNIETAFQLRSLSLDFLTNIVSLVFAVIGPISESRSWERYDISSGDFKILDNKQSSLTYLNLLVVSCAALGLNLLFYIFSYDMSLIFLLIISLIYLFVFVAPMIVKVYIRRDHHIDKVSIKNEVTYFIRYQAKDKSQSEKDEIVEKLITNRMLRNGFLATYNEIYTKKSKTRIDKTEVSRKLISLFNNSVEDTYLNRKHLEGKYDFSVLDILNNYNKSLYEIIANIQDRYAKDDKINKPEKAELKNIGYSFSHIACTIWENPDYSQIKEHFTIRFKNTLDWYRSDDLKKSTCAMTIWNAMISKSIYQKDLGVLYLFNDVFRKPLEKDELDNYFVFITFYLVTILGLSERFANDSFKSNIKDVLSTTDWSGHFMGTMKPINNTIDDNYVVWFASLYEKMISMYSTIDKFDWIIPEYNFVSSTFIKYDFNDETIGFIWFYFILINSSCDENFITLLNANLSEKTKGLINRIASEFVGGENTQAYRFIKSFANSLNEAGLINYKFEEHHKDFIDLSKKIKCVIK